MLGRLVQEDFGVGVQQNVAPHLIDPRGLYAAFNALFNEDGSVYKRGGSVAHSDTAFGSALRGVWDGWLNPGRRTLLASPGDFGVLDSNDASPVNLGGAGWTVPRVAREIEDLLFIGGGSIYGGSRKAADYVDGTVDVTQDSQTVTGNGTAWEANVDAGMLLRIGANDRVYVVSSVDSDTQLTLRDAYEDSTAGAANYTLRRIEDADGPYKSCNYYAVVSRRLTVCDNNALWFSEPGKPHVFEATIQPSGTKVDNVHRFDEGVRLLGAESLGPGRVLVFTTHGFWVISNLSHNIVDGLGNQQHRIDQVSRDIVLWGNSGVTGWQDSLIVPGTDDIYLFDGASEPLPISRSIRSLYRGYVRNGRTVGQAHVYRDHYFLPIIEATGQPVDLLCVRLDHPRRVRGESVFPCSFMRDSGAEVSGVEVRSVSAPAEQPKLLGAAADGLLLELSHYFEPSAAVKNDHDDTTPNFEIHTRDFDNGRQAIARWRRFRCRYEMEPVAQETPQLYADIGSLLREEAPGVWDQEDWDNFFWAAAVGVEFIELEDPGPAPANAGSAAQLAQNAWDWFANSRLRYVRFRLRSADPVAKLTIRGLEIFVAETGGVRHSKVT